MIGQADLSRFQDVPADKWLLGTVEHIQPYGALVKVPLPDDGGSAIGLVHKSQIKEGFVENVADEFEVGEAVYVRVLRVTEDGLDLSTKDYTDLGRFREIPADTWLLGT